jgi:hypothetical protein
LSGRTGPPNISRIVAPVIKTAAELAKPHKLFASQNSPHSQLIRKPDPRDLGLRALKILQSGLDVRIDGLIGIYCLIKSRRCLAQPGLGAVHQRSSRLIHPEDLHHLVLREPKFTKQIAPTVLRRRPISGRHSDVGRLGLLRRQGCCEQEES